MNKNFALSLGVVLSFGLIGTRVFAAEPAARCEAGKVKAIGKYVGCLANLHAKAAITGVAVDPTATAKCADKFLNSWDKAQANGSGMCADPPGADASIALATAALCAAWASGCVQGDDPDICAGVCDTCTADLATCSGNLGGCTGNLANCNTDLAMCQDDLTACQAITCGDGSIVRPEECEGANLDGATCPSLGFVGGILRCSSGCRFDTTECYASRFEDTGLTVIDHQTGLEWEKKVAGSGCLHCDDPTGRDWFDAVGNWLSQVNGLSSTAGPQTDNGLAGYSDWRIPGVDELLSIADCSGGSPCIDPTFGPTLAAPYWSSTTQQLNPSIAAWRVTFSPSGDASVAQKTGHEAVRAVRTR